jgi:hypothetical protein
MSLPALSKIFAVVQTKTPLLLAEAFGNQVFGDAVAQKPAKNRVLYPSRGLVLGVFDGCGGASSE